MRHRSRVLRHSVPIPALVAAAVVTVLALVHGGATAAQSPAPAAPTVRDVAEILAGPIRVVPDPSGTSVTLEVTTTVDAACAVVFGEDATFGRLATDLDMAGGGHRDHRPILAGLEPDTTYVYRIQGSAEDGTLYQGAIGSFRTPRAADLPGADLAADATVVAVSSEYSDAFVAVNALDRDPSTEWSSRGDGDEAFLELDLGAERQVAWVGFLSREMADGSAITRTFTVTADGGEILGPFTAGPDPVPVSVSARRLRFDVETSTGGNTGAREVVVRGPGPDSEGDG